MILLLPGYQLSIFYQNFQQLRRVSNKSNPLCPSKKKQKKPAGTAILLLSWLCRGVHVSTLTQDNISWDKKWDKALTIAAP